MGHTIEIGDIVEIIESYKKGTNAKVRSINNGYYDLEHYNILEYSGTYETTSGYTIDDIKLVSKAVKQEIIGYVLLKNLPGIPAGTVYNEYGRAVGFEKSESEFGIKWLQDTTWFKPIYKSQEIVVKISNDREVKITPQYVSLNNKDFFGTKNVEEIREFSNKTSKVSFNTSAPYLVSISTVKIGCQEFNKEDIELVYKTIQNIK